MKNEKLNLAEWVMNYALQQGADDVKVDINNTREIEVKYRDRKLENLKESTSNSLWLSIYSKKRFSGHGTSDMRKESLKKFISEAVSATKYLSEDEFRSLPDPKYYPKNMDIDLNIYDKDFETITSEKRKQIAEEIESITLEQSDKIISAECGYTDGCYESVKVLSNGFKGESSSTYFSAGASVTVKDDNGSRPEDWYWGSTHFFNDLPIPELLAKEAVKRALNKIGQSKIESGKYDIVVENRAAGRLLGMLNYPITARALQQKSSFLEGMLNKKIASEKLTVYDDPFLKKGISSCLFDGDGVAARKKTVIEKGILRQYYIDVYYGKKLGMEPNFDSPTNILFENGTRNLVEMIKDLKRGVLVTGFIGGNSNSTTGDFSFGLVGQLIENGERVKAVNELNISGNAKDFWNTLIEVGNDPDPYSSWMIPTLAFEKADISGL